MSYPFSSDFDSPSRLFGGVARQSTNRRLHQVARPYSRPASYTGPSASTQNGNANVAPTPQGRMGEPTQPPSMFTRPLPNSISTSTVASGMTRSRSDPSLGHRASRGGLLSNFKSMFSRPLQWLATPSRGTRREQDVEDQESPVVQRRLNGSVESPLRAEARTQMLPPLPPHVTLSPRNRPPTATSFSRPLHTVRSLPHIDPPVFNSPSSGRTSGVLTRSRRANVEETEDEVDDKAIWSPWKDQQRRASPRLTPARSTTPLRRGSVQDRPLPSQSPFRPTRSPSQRANGSGLYRSNTTANTTTFARAGSVMSDVSMGKESIKSPRKAGSMLFSHKEDGMSVDGEAEGSMGFFSKERWENGSARASPARAGPAIRRGQLVWDSEKGFVRESELHQDRARPVGKNEAEKILFALEAQREGPLKTASSPSLHHHSLPPELIGASSRTLRQAISVPLATAMAGATARGRRDKERAEDKSSLMISPYGRRRQVDEDARHERKVTREREEEYHPSSDRQPSPSDHSSRGDTDYSMHSESEAEAPPPRRSRRHKRRDTTPAETTPKVRKTGKGEAAGESARAKQDSPTKTRRSKRHAETPSSPAPPQFDKSVPPVPSVPTITETAPSPDAKSTSNYAPRADGEFSREGSSLRAKSSVSKRTHGPSVSLTNSRATSPTSSGRYSAKEEDLPPMDELEAAKIPFNSFSGVSFALDKPASKPDNPPAPSGSLASRIGPPKNETLGVPRISSGPLSRINSSRPRASSPLASSSVVAAPESPPSDQPVPAIPPSGGIFPLASTGSTTPTNPPPASLFAGIGSGEPKKSSGLGLGKPSAEPSAVPDFFGKKSQPGSGTVTPSSQPFNFGAAAEPPKAPLFEAPKTNGSTPITFGSTNGAKSAESKTDAPAPSKSPVSFGTPAEASKPAFSFGQPSTPAEKPVEPPKPFTGFTFGQTSTQPAPATEKPNGANGTSTGFSFAKPAETPSAEPAKASFSFEASSTPTEPAKPTFNFGAATPAESKPTNEPAKPTGFSFGAPAAPAPAASGSFSSNKPAERAPTPSTFAFGTQANGSGNTENKAPGSGSTSFGGFGNPPQANGTSNTFGNPPASTGFAFGSSNAPAPTNSFGAAPTPPSNTFGSVPATPSNGFSSAPPSALASSGSGFNFSFPSPVQTNGAAPSPSFGFGQQPSPSTPSNTAGPFQFGSGTPQSSGSTPFTFGASGGTPQSQGSQPFVFGGGGGMNGQPPQPPRFGSPGPGQESPSGGFSMGMEPSSPSGRKIKPLRRGAVKR